MTALGAAPVPAVQGRRGTYAAAGLLVALEAAFFRLDGCLRRLSEGLLGCDAGDGARGPGCPFWQSLSVMLPFWILLGIIAYNAAILMILRGARG